MRQMKFGKLSLPFLGPLLAFSLCGAAVTDCDADEAAAPRSKHQLMKDCMAKQKASDSGRPKEDMKQDCKDVTKTEKQNADKAADSGNVPQK